MNALRLAYLLSLAVVIGAGCASGPSPSADPVIEPGPAVTAQVERNGVRVGLTLEHDLIATGADLRVHIEARSLGPAPAAWSSGGCGMVEDLSIDGPALVQPDAGRDWPGTAGLAKWSATAGGVSFGPFRDVRWPRDMSVACAAILEIEDLAPGDVTQADAYWIAETTNAVPALPGRYRVSYAFAYLGPDWAGDFSSEPHKARPIEVQAAFRVAGKPFAGITAPAAIDAAYADPRVIGWVSAVTREQLNGAWIRYDKGTWLYQVQAVGETLRVRVHPTSGLVIDVSVEQ